MADPQRIVDDLDASPLARSLLASASADAPTAAHRATLAKRLGLAAALVAAGGGEVGAGTVGVALWWKAGLIVLALGGAITGGVLVTREAAPEARPQVAVSPAQVAVAQVAVVPVPVPVIAEPAPPAVTERQMVPPAAAPTTPAAVTPPRDLAPTTPLPAAPKPVAPPPRVIALAAPTPTPTLTPAAPTPAPATANIAEPPEAAPASAPPPPPTSPPAVPTVDARRLAAEVAVLDRARAALRRGDPAAAAAALDAHAREFANGALVAEAELVRIETLVRRGDAAAARDRARGFLIRFPQSPLAKRLRSLVDRLPPAAKESP